VSVGIAVYNGQQFIEQALDSLLSQSFRNFEIIICDNDSQDRTEQICREYMRRDPRVRYYRNPTNLGLAGNWARVLKLARGKYFKYAAYDDFCAPELLERCVDVLDRRPDVILVYPKTMLLDELSGKLTEYEDRQNLQSGRPSERFAQLLQEMRLCNIIFGLHRTSELRKTAGYRRHLGADLVLMAELSLRGKFYEIPEFLFYRRLHPSASSSMRDRKQLEAYLEPAVARQDRSDLYTWHQLFGHLRSIFRTPLPAVERARLIILLLRMAVWDRKRLLAEFWGIVELCRIRLGHLFEKSPPPGGGPRL
jgi:glycosyltransferase involved in cell wall biosynthesis